MPCATCLWTSGIHLQIYVGRNYNRREENSNLRPSLYEVERGGVLAIGRPTDLYFAKANADSKVSAHVDTD